MPKSKGAHEKRKGRETLVAGYIPVRILEDGSLDFHYLPSLKDLLKLEGRYLVDLAKLKGQPLENFADEESKAIQIRNVEHNIEIVRKKIKKRRMAGA